MPQLALQILGDTVDEMASDGTTGAMPLLLLFASANHPTATLLNYEPVAEEIVRTLVGSIGLVLAVPFTTFIAAYWYKTKR